MALEQQMRMEEPESTGFGGSSPYIVGLPIEEYRKLVPAINIQISNPNIFLV